MIPILTANTVSDQPPQLQLWLQGRACRDHSPVELVETTRCSSPPTPLVEPWPRWSSLSRPPARPSFTSAPHCCYRSPVVELPSSTTCPPISAATGEWRNGRRAGFRCQCPSGRGGSSPPSPTTSSSARCGTSGQVAEMRSDLLFCCGRFGGSSEPLVVGTCGWCVPCSACAGDGYEPTNAGDHDFRAGFSMWVSIKNPAIANPALTASFACRGAGPTERLPRP